MARYLQRAAEQSTATLEPRRCTVCRRAANARRRVLRGQRKRCSRPGLSCLCGSVAPLLYLHPVACVTGQPAAAATRAALQPSGSADLTVVQHGSTGAIPAAGRHPCCLQSYCLKFKRQMSDLSRDDRQACMQTPQQLRSQALTTLLEIPNRQTASTGVNVALSGIHQSHL